MIRFALQGLLARKLRTALTAIGVVLGVALISGTYVLTDSITSAFDSIFTENYKNTDAAITGKNAIDASQDGTVTAPPFDAGLLTKVRELPEVGAAGGGVGGEAQLIGKDGKAIVFGGAPNLGFSVDPALPQFNSLSLVSGSWPAAGHAPDTRLSELNCGCAGSTLKPMFGAPPNTMTLPSLPISCASPLTAPPAAPTSGSSRTLSSSPAWNAGAVTTVPSSAASNAVFPVIAASVFL